MRSRFSCALVVLVACDGSSTTTTTTDHGYLLVSRSALDARAHLDDALVGPMPVALEDKAYTLAIGDRKLAIDADESVLTYAHATDAYDTFIVGGDVYADRLTIEAAQPAVARIADALGATVEASGDGRWILRGDDLWPRVAGLEPSGVTELFPILITEDGRGAIARTTATPPSVPSVPSVSAEQRVAPAAASERVTRKLSCEDPLAGVWVARTYRTYDWHEFTLHLDRTAGRVDGTIDVKFWAGEPDDPTIGECADGTSAAGTGTMTAKGAFSGNRLKLDAKRLLSINGMCGDDAPDYQLDHFTATMSTDGRLMAKNNDGRNAFNRPYVFERVACDR